MKSSASEPGLRQPTMKADFSLKRALIRRELWQVMKKRFGRDGRSAFYCNLFSKYSVQNK